MSEKLALLDRIVNALKKMECFIFEVRELDAVRDLTIKAGIDRDVEIKPVDERYSYILALIPSSKGLDRECLARVETALSRGELSQNEYKRYKSELLEQCIHSLRFEKVKKIINTLEEYRTRLIASHG